VRRAPPPTPNYAEEKLPGRRLKLYPTADEYKLELSNGRIDAAIDDVVVLSQWVTAPRARAARSLALAARSR
jgi:polar amino acid transport system substrate-binding protein